MSPGKYPNIYANRIAIYLYVYVVGGGVDGDPESGRI